MMKFTNRCCLSLGVLLLVVDSLFAQGSGQAIYRVYSATAPGGYTAILDFSPTRALYRGKGYTGDTRTKVVKKEFTQEGGEVFININVTAPADEVCVVMDGGKGELRSYACMMRGGNLYEFVTYEPLREIAWELTDSTKAFGNFTARGARCSFRGRDYDVWFLPEIPVSFGPWKFNGLPGLILEASERHGGVFRFVLEGIEVKEGHTVPDAVFPKRAKRIPIDVYAYYHDSKSADENDLAQARAPRGAKVTAVADSDGGIETDVERNFKALVAKGAVSEE